MMEKEDKLLKEKIMLLISIIVLLYVSMIQMKKSYKLKKPYLNFLKLICWKWILEVRISTNLNNLIIPFDQSLNEVNEES